MSEDAQRWRGFSLSRQVMGWQWLSTENAMNMSAWSHPTPQVTLTTQLLNLAVIAVLSRRSSVKAHVKSRWVSVGKCMDWLYRSGICNTKQSPQSVSMWIKCLMTFPLTVKAKREHIWHLSAKPYDSVTSYPAMFFSQRCTDPYCCCTGQTHYMWGIMHAFHA